MSTAIWWIRRDLRLVDNQALQSAMDNADQIAPVFILDPKLISSPYVAEKRLAFLFAGLRELDASLRQRGSYLILRQGDPLIEMTQLLKETAASAIYAEPDYSPYARSRDQGLSKELPLRSAGSPALLPPGFILNKAGRPYTVFTPFSQAWQAALSIQSGVIFDAPRWLPTPLDLKSLPTLSQLAEQDATSFPAGESEASQRLQRFTRVSSEEGKDGSADIYHYADGRDQLAINGTSALSPYFRFGMLSARQAVATVFSVIENAPDAQARKSAEVWLNELIWREFYIHILYHYPHVRRGNFRPSHVRWTNNPEHFEAWKAGNTGYPVVDAAMRQLLHSGWMHNRARMIVASFLTKDLFIDWRWGEKWFMQHLLDGDPASNNGGWQWAAGTGADAAPYFRIFNPISQSQKHDPRGKYIRRWLPDLERVPDDYIHQPWLMPPEVQKKSGVIIGMDYPAPLVDHAEARVRALQAYRKV